MLVEISFIDEHFREYTNGKYFLETIGTKGLRCAVWPDGVHFSL